MEQANTQSHWTLSICIPAYNAADLLRRCLDSIVQQTIQPDEVIITDDSTDDHTRVLAQLYEQWLPIRYEHHEKALGSPANWNRGLSLAKGKWVMVLHQDDWFSSPDSIGYFMDAASLHPDIEFVFGEIAPDEKPEEIEKIPVKINQLPTNPELILRQNLIGPPSNVMFRNKQEYFDEKLFWVVDFEMYFRWLKNGRDFYYIPRKLVEIGRHEQQITAYCDLHPEVKLRENAYLLTKHQQQIRMDIPLYDYYWRQIRNTAASIPKTEMAELSQQFPPLMQQQWNLQQKLSAGNLQKGWFSKIMMIFSWLKYIRS